MNMALNLAPTSTWFIIGHSQWLEVPRHSHGQKFSVLALAWYKEAPNTKGNNITSSCSSPYKHGQVGIRFQLQATLMVKTTHEIKGKSYILDIVYHHIGPRCSLSSSRPISGDTAKKNNGLPAAPGKPSLTVYFVAICSSLLIWWHKGRSNHPAL